MLLAFFLFTPLAAAAPTQTFYDQSPNTALVATKATSPKTAPPRTVVRETVHSSPTEYKALIRQISVTYGVSAEVMENVIDCETGGTWNPTMQSTYPNKRDGGRELSFGLAQIHLPDHPDVSRAEATDPEFAIRWMAKEFKAGRQSEWSCWRKVYR